MSTRRRRATATATATTTSRDDDALAEELFRSLRDAVRASAREANARRRDATDGFDRWLYAEIFWRFFRDAKNARERERTREEATDGEARRAIAAQGVSEYADVDDVLGDSGANGTRRTRDDETTRDERETRETDERSARG